MGILGFTRSPADDDRLREIPHRFRGSSGGALASGFGEEKPR
jgi:hypothetical protein